MTLQTSSATTKRCAKCGREWPMNQQVCQCEPPKPKTAGDCSTCKRMTYPDWEFPCNECVYTDKGTYDHWEPSKEACHELERERDEALKRHHEMMELAQGIEQDRGKLSDTVDALKDAVASAEKMARIRLRELRKAEKSLRKAIARAERAEALVEAAYQEGWHEHSISDALTWEEDWEQSGTAAILRELDQ